MFRLSKIFKFTMVLAGIVGVAMIGFNGWNWYLAISGQTTVEFMKKRTGMHEPNEVLEFSTGLWRLNLEKVFGT
jgi:hypothetical protein